MAVAWSVVRIKFYEIRSAGFYIELVVALISYNSEGMPPTWAQAIEKVC
jgi:hypothetical protein